MKSWDRGLLAAALLVAAPVGQSAPILNPANGHFYEFVSTALFWDAARIESLGLSHLGADGHLLAITSAEEQAFFLANFRGIKAWLGGFQPSDSAVEADLAAGWLWVTGEAFSYAAWQEGQPDDFRAPGGFAQGYFVEYEFVPEPGVSLLLGFGLAGIRLTRRFKKSRGA